MRQRFAKLFVRDTVRNTILEDYHAGIPLPKEYRDEKYSRISDAEMKRFMQEVVDKTYTMLTFISEQDEVTEKMVRELEKRDFMPEWDDPEFLTGKLWGNKQYK